MPRCILCVAHIEGRSQFGGNVWSVRKIDKNEQQQGVVGGGRGVVGSLEGFPTNQKINCSVAKSLLLPLVLLLLPLLGYRRCCQTVSRLSGLPCRCQGDHRLLHKQTLTNTWQLSNF